MSELTDKKLSEEEIPSAMGEDDIVGGLVDGIDAQITPQVLSERLNQRDQDHSGYHVKAATFEGSAPLLTDVVATGPGGSESEADLTLLANSLDANPTSKIRFKKGPDLIGEFDENGLSPKSGIPYTHEDAAIPIAKDTNHLGNYALGLQTIQDSWLGPVFNFKGAEYITVADNININFGANDGSINIRFQTSKDYSGGAGIIMTKRNTGGLREGYRMQVTAANKLEFIIDQGVLTYLITSDDVVNDGEWHTATIKINADSLLSMLVDAIPQADEKVIADAISITSTVDLYIGSNDSGSGSFFTGSTTTPIFFNRLPTDNEAKAFSNPQFAIPYPDIGGSNAVLADADSTFSSDTGFWTKGAGVTIPGDNFCHAAAAPNGSSLIKNTTVLNIGKITEVTFTISNYSAGTLFVVGITGGQTGRNANGTYTVTGAADAAQLSINSSGISTSDISNVIVRQLGATLELPPEDFSPWQGKDRMNALIATPSSQYILQNKAGGKIYPQEYIAIADNDTFLVPDETAMLEIWINVRTAEAATTIRIGTADAGEQVVADSTAPQTTGLQKLTVLISKFVAGDTLYIGTDGGAWSTVVADLYINYRQIKGIL